MIETRFLWLFPAALAACAAPVEPGSARSSATLTIGFDDVGAAEVAASDEDSSPAALLEPDPAPFLFAQDLAELPYAWSADDVTRTAVSRLAGLQSGALALRPGRGERWVRLSPALNERVAGPDRSRDGRYAVLHAAYASAQCGNTQVPLERIPEVAAEDPAIDEVVLADDGPRSGPADGTRVVTRDPPPPPLPPLLPPPRPAFGTPLQHNRDGICAPIAIAQSLHRHLGIVPFWWANVTDASGTAFSAAFLQAIAFAGDEPLNDGAMITPQISQAHTARWNTAFDIVESQPWTWMNRDSCDEVRAHCEELRRLKHDERDDCMLVLATDTARTSESGHILSIREVAFDELTCTCNVVSDDTGNQDPAKDYVGVPIDPGTQQWSIRVASVLQTGGASTAWWNEQGYQAVSYACYSEEAASGSDGIWTPGPAMP